MVRKVSKRSGIKGERKNGQKRERTYLKTGIPGFDSLIRHGIEKGTNLLVSGGPGSGKTVFGLQCLYNGTKNKEKCLYVSFEERPKRLRQHMKDFGWDVDKMEKEGLLQIVKCDAFKIARSVEAMLMKAKGELSIDLKEVPSILPRGFLPDRVVIDSISALESAFFGLEYSYRIYIEQLFNFLSETSATSFLITESEQNVNKYSKSGVEEFLADGVIVMYNIKIGDTRTRAVEILKLRGAKHEKRIVPFKITDRGIMVYPEEHVFEGAETI